jgi:hypothetical protein
VVVHGRWARSGRLLVCRRTGLVVFKNMPRGSNRMDSSACWVGWSGGAQDRKSEALLSAPLGTSDPGPEHKAAEPQGAREARASAGCHATLQAQEIDLPLIQEGPKPDELAWTYCVCEQRWCA